MPLLVPNVGEDKFLQNVLNKTAPENLTLKLFKSNTTPTEADTAATYTEADFIGYTPIALTGATWTVVAGAPSEATYPQQTFTSTAGSQSQQVYGYYVVGASDGVLRWAERFPDGPYPIVNNGDQIKVTPKLTLD